MGVAFSFANNNIAVHGGGAALCLLCFFGNEQQLLTKNTFGTVWHFAEHLTPYSAMSIAVRCMHDPTKLRQGVGVALSSLCGCRITTVTSG